MNSNYCKVLLILFCRHPWVIGHCRPLKASYVYLPSPYFYSADLSSRFRALFCGGVCWESRKTSRLLKKGSEEGSDRCRMVVLLQSCTGFRVLDKDWKWSAYRLASWFDPGYPHSSQYCGEKKMRLRIENWHAVGVKYGKDITMMSEALAHNSSAVSHYSHSPTLRNCRMKELTVG